MQAGGDAHHDSPEGGTSKDTWYVVVSFQPRVEERAERTGNDPRYYVTDAFYSTHHWKDDIERRDGAWWIPYDTEEKCRDGCVWISAEESNVGCYLFARVVIANPDREVVETLYVED
ncbi:hypothetical protein BHE90_017572 [Fusarium euwallaceae]|uniref:Uncharacterized protein n=1 Tax=Fusarium euwallaceae TaxID=1147111 RepID=A0A430KX30_9HYPO|nr:hypothetical protein BHE90_017572 [Fusarium euwallaceae]